MSITPVSRAKLVVFTKARVEGRQGRYKGRKVQAIQEEDKTRGKAMDKKRSYITSPLNQPIKPKVQNVKIRFSPRR